LFGVLALIVFRLQLTADSDLLAVNQGADDLWQIRTAAEGVWSGSYWHMKGVHLPVYSMWLWAGYKLGFHARLAYDLLWCVGALALGVAYYRAQGGRLAAVCITLFMLFHPAGITLADRALAENILPPLVAVAFALGLEFWRVHNGTAIQRWSIALALSAICAICYHTRREGIVLLIPLVILGATWLHPGWRPQKWRTLTIGFFFGPVVAITLLGMSITIMNRQIWGFNARCQLLTPGYNEALKALYSIKPSAPNPRYVTVTNETRRVAYSVSPTFAELKPVFEEQLLPYVMQRDYGIGSPQGEFPDGWFYWDIREAAARTGWHRSAATAEEKYAAVAREINSAIAKGRLAGRPVILSGLSPEYSRWIPQLPLATWHTLKLFLNIASNQINLINRNLTEDASPLDINYYYKVAGRRRKPDLATHIAGWLQAPAGAQLALGGKNIPQTWTSPSLQHPSLKEAWLFDMHQSPDLQVTRLWLQLPDKTVSFLPLQQVIPGQVFTFAANQTAVGIDSFSVPNFRRNSTSYLDVTIRYWEWISWIAFTGGVLALTVNAFHRRPLSHFICLLALLCLTALVGRCLMVAMIDVAAWPMQYRYIFPALPLLAILLGVGITTLTTWNSCNKKSNEPRNVA